MGELEQRVEQMRARGYRVLSRGSSVVVLRRDADRSRSLLDVAVIVLSVALVAFGLWRGSWLFAVVGAVLFAVVGAAWWIRRRSMTVRLTLDPAGKVREELIDLGDDGGQDRGLST